MKTKQRGILTLLLAFIVHLTFAQQKTISGVVSDQDGIPLPGVNILVKGTTTGTQTGFDGEYSISASKGQVLLFTYLGQTPTSRTIADDNVINVQMQEDSQALEEVVVTAMGTKRNKRSLGYAQQTVTAEELVTTKQTDIVNSMAGKIAGVQIMAAPKSGFNRSQIRLRGSQDVLYVVDGIRLQSSDDVNPEDVKSMSVLKGSAATALYGPEGRNGAVIITTRKGKNGQASITYDGSVEISNADYIHELQNQYGGGYSQTFDTFSYDPAKDPASWAAFDGDKIFNYAADESWGPKLDGQLVRQWESWIPSNSKFGQSTPWVSNGGIGDFFNTGLNTKHNVTFLKGGEGYNLKLNVLRNDLKLNIDNANRADNRISFSGDMDISPKLNISTNVSFQDRSTLNNPSEGYNSVGSNVFQWWQAQLDIDALKDYRQGGNIVSWNIKGPRDATPKYWDSPYFETRENLKHASRKSIIGNIGLDYKFTDYLTAKLSLNKTYEIRNFDSRVAFEGLNTPEYRESYWSRDRNLLLAQLAFNKEFGDFSVSAIGGTELNQLTYQSLSSATKNGLTIPGFYSIETSTERPDYNRYTSEQKSRAMYLTTTLGYKNMLFLDGSIRKDWSSTANPDDNSVLTKGLTASFVFSELLEDSFLSYGKLRGGIAQGPQFPNTYQLSETYGVQPSYGGKPVLSTSSAIFNQQLVGGVREEIEFGTELRFLQNRLGLDVTYFKKTDKNLPTALELDATTGYASVLVNSGEQTYEGFEVAISGTPIRNDNFTWNTSINFATLERKVIKLAEGLNQSDTPFLSSRWGGLVLRNEEGKNFGEVYGRKIKEIDGQKVIDPQSGTYVTEDNQSLGNYLPDVTGGFINSFKYKNLTLHVDMDYQIGGKYFSITRMFINSSGLGEATVGDNKLGNPVRDPLNGTFIKNADGDDVTDVI
ncbi:MAG: SusC/RagA family TonB-linked outer membrane protein, partial [Cellulophaga sp.]